MPQHFASLVTHMGKTMQAGGLCTWPARAAASLSREALHMTDGQTRTVTDIKEAYQEASIPMCQHTLWFLALVLGKEARAMFMLGRFWP